MDQAIYLLVERRFFYLFHPVPIGYKDFPLQGCFGFFLDFQICVNHPMLMLNRCRQPFKGQVLIKQRLLADMHDTYIVYTF